MGSSPLTRGKRGLHRPGPARAGLIPAHAGKTSGAVPRLAPTRAHPRSRGENSRKASWVLIEAGSSPLTRGKHAVSAPVLQVRGLIPAHAGKTLPDAACTSGQWAHPRSRGENVRPPSSERSTLGSSPLTRGKHTRKRQYLACSGLIPAHAGKTLPDLRFYRADRSDLGKP